MKAPHRPAEPRLAALVFLALLPGLLLAAYYDVCAYRTAATLGFPLDDSWIHAQFARNLATGSGFTYTGHAWVSGSTAPAWTVILAVAFFAFRNMILAATVIGVVCQIIAGYYGTRLAHLLGTGPWASRFAGTLVVAAPVMVWGAVSGMEVTLAAALVLAGLYYLLRHDDQQRPALAGLALLSLASLARPESLTIVALAIASELLRSGRCVQRMRRGVIATCLAVSITAPLAAFSFATIGHPLPSTFYAKSGPGIVRAIETQDTAMAVRALTISGPMATSNFVAILYDQFWAGAFLIPVGIVACFASVVRRRAAWMLLAVLVVVPFTIGLVAPQRLKPDNVRYAGQLVAVAAPLIAVALAWMLRRREVLALALVVIVCGTCWRTIGAAPLFAISVKNVYQLHVTAGRWMRDNLPAGSVVAVNDVGAIAYFSRLPILDLEGLVSPVALPYRHLPERGLRLVTDLHPQFLAIFPHWYPELAARHDLFTEIHRVHISDNYISAGDTLIVYRTPWGSPTPDDRHAP